MQCRSVVAVLATIMALVANASPAMPRLAFQAVGFENSNFDYPRGVFTNPKGVDGPSSPLVTAGNGWARSYTISGELLKHRSFSTDAQLNFLASPVMNTDAKGNSLFVVSQSGSGCKMNVTAFIAAPLETTWSYLPDPCGSMCCQIQEMVYVEPTLAHACPNGGGAGAVSVLTCSYSGENCTVSVVDLHTGALCGAQSIPDGYFRGNQGSDTWFKAIPSGGKLTRPMFIVQSVRNQPTVYGVDAASGMITYTVSTNALFGGFVGGTSLDNQLFATYYQGDSTRVFFREIATGKLWQTNQESDFYNYSVSFTANTLGWTPLGTSKVGGVTILADNSINGGNGVSVFTASAANWSARVVSHDFSNAFVPQFYPDSVIGVGDSWTMALVGGQHSYQIIGVPSSPTPSGATRFTYALPPTPSGLNNGGLFPFVLNNGTEGFASFCWGAPRGNAPIGNAPAGNGSVSVFLF